MCSKPLNPLFIVLLTSLCFLYAVAFGGDNCPSARDITVLHNPPPRKRIVHTPYPETQSNRSGVLSLLVDGVTDTLIFDDGNPVSAYYWEPGYRMAARMSPDTAQAEIKIIAVIFYHWVPGAFFPGIYAWSGSNPADTLLQWNDTSTVAGFNTFMVDTANIIVQGDFVVSHGVVDTITALGYDNYNNGRAWDFDPGTRTWNPYLETYFIRAIVEYQPFGAVPPNFAVLVPRAFSLDPPYPNPFNPTTNLVVQLAHSGPVALKIYDLLGQEVATLVDGFHPSGTVKVSWDAGQSASGIYWAVLSNRSDHAIRKLVLLK
jgi:hypothetical protein